MALPKNGVSIYPVETPSLFFTKTEKMDMEEIISYEKRRGNCYKLLAACFYQPEKELLIQQNLFLNLSSLLREICPDAERFSSRMEEALLQYNQEELSVEYAKLFVGPYELQAPPYGSVYLDEGRRVMGDSTMEVIRAYREAGLLIDDEFEELPDHIAVELEFVYYLIYKEAEALENSEVDTASHFIRHQELFLNKFLGQWVRPFCENIKENTNNEFYIALADCVSAFVSVSRLPNDLQKLLERKTRKVLN